MVLRPLAWRATAVAFVAAGGVSMLRHRSTLLRTALFAAVLLAVRNIAWREREIAVKFSRPASAFVKWLMDGSPARPPGAFKDFMYDCFQRDVHAGEHANFEIGTHQSFSATSRELRMVSFNVHFFQRGFSGVIKGDSMDEVLRLVGLVNPDVLALQEVPPSRLPELQQGLAALGLPHSVAASSADVHVLDPAVGVYPNERLHVVLASRLPFRSSAAVPMLDGHAAFAEVELGGAGDGVASSAYVYSGHLSVRCEGSKRRDEVSAVLEHVATLGQPHKLTLIAGDFNQPNEVDYPPEEWAAIAADMRRAKLDLSDGAMERMRSVGFVPSFEASMTPRPLPATTAWNGALVDYIYTNRPSYTRVLATRAYHTLASDHLPLVGDFALQ